MCFLLAAYECGFYNNNKKPMQPDVTQGIIHTECQSPLIYEYKNSRSSNEHLYDIPLVKQYSYGINNNNGDASGVNNESSMSKKSYQTCSIDKPYSDSTRSLSSMSSC